MTLVLAFFIVIFSVSSSWGASSCSHLKQELKAMQNAQKQIMLSLVNNHETFASSLEEYSHAVRVVDGSSKTITASKMDQSAQAFRNRGVQGKKMTAKLNKATQDLIARISACIK